MACKTPIRSPNGGIGLPWFLLLVSYSMLQAFAGVIFGRRET